MYPFLLSMKLLRLQRLATKGNTTALLVTMLELKIRLIRRKMARSERLRNLVC